MKIEELILEAPLPDDWDASIYNNKISFEMRVSYAKQHATRLGTGSSRIAFEIPYQGRNTVLKIAKNKKGLAQNEYESEMLHDYYLVGLNITIPMIDFDEANHPPTWIHVEKAARVTMSVFTKYFSGLEPIQLIELAKNAVGRGSKQGYANLPDNYRELSESNEHIHDFINLVGNYDIDADDFSNIKNWGVYNNNVVIIDVGGSTAIIKQYYSKNKF